jgi:simple sugar transport system substrate-binding protein
MYQVKKIIQFCLLILLIIILVACGSLIKKSTDSKIVGKKDKIILGFAQLGDESNWRTANTKSIISAARDAGIDLVFSDAQQDQSKQIKEIRSFIAQQVDIIAFSPIVESGWDSVLQEAKAAGIPVIITDRSIKTSDQSLYKTLIGSDFLEEGRKAGEWLIKKLGNSKKDVNIFELQGTLGATPTLERKKGFQEAIYKQHNFKIVATQYADFMNSKGKEVMSDYLKKSNTKIDVLFAHNDDMALGAIEAIEEAGFKPGKDIVIISIDAVDEAFRAMIGGKLNCTVECNPLLGPMLMQTVKNIIDGVPIPKWITTEEGIFSQETAQRDIIGRKY